MIPKVRLPRKDPVYVVLGIITLLPLGALLVNVCKNAQVPHGNLARGGTLSRGPLQRWHSISF
jgi:hypothetical protein